MSKDTLGDRIKSNYEDRTRYFLPRRTYTIIRLDGKAFHSFTKQFKRPYDLDLMDMMDNTAAELCKQVQGARCAYVQSDEINMVITDFEEHGTCAWFDGNLQKMASVSASIATAAFNREYLKYLAKGNGADLDKVKLAHFDSRVFTVADYNEVLNVIIWRQQDATKNAIQMLGHHYFSNKDLHKKNTSEVQDMLMLQKGVNFNDQPVGFKRGRLIRKETYEVPITGPTKMVKGARITHTRTRWIADEPPIFTQDRDYLCNLIPKLNQ